MATQPCRRSRSSIRAADRRCLWQGMVVRRGSKGFTPRGPFGAVRNSAQVPRHSTCMKPHGSARERPADCLALFLRASRHGLPVFGMGEAVLPASEDGKPHGNRALLREAGSAVSASAIHFGGNEAAKPEGEGEWPTRRYFAPGILHRHQNCHAGSGPAPNGLKPLPVALGGRAPLQCQD